MQLAEEELKGQPAVSSCRPYKCGSVSSWAVFFFLFSCEKVGKVTYYKVCLGQ